MLHTGSHTSISDRARFIWVERFDGDVLEKAVFPAGVAELLVEPPVLLDGQFLTVGPRPFAFCW
jgi:hypothetical protein